MHRFRRCALPVAAALAVGAVAALPPAPAATQDATPAACEQTTPEQNEEIVRQWFDALASGESDAVAPLTTPDVVYHAPSPDLPPITESAESWADERQADYPDLTTTVEHVFATDDMAAAYVRFAGTHSGDTEEGQGVPATGQHVEWVSMVHFRIECGLIAEVWSVADELGRLQRIGVITADELQSAEPVATPAP
jgi:steroid delta-isomerase-like uncharacterized protein